MAKKNFGNELEELKTSFLGYDKEAVMLYIKELIEQLEQENEARQKELYLEKAKLSSENHRLQEEQATHQKVYTQLSERMEQMAAAVEKSEGYARERDRALAGYQSREKELEELEEQARTQAQEILGEAQVQAQELLGEAKTQAKELLEEADAQAKEHLAGADSQAKKLLESAAATKEQILEKAQLQVEEFLSQAREEALQQRSLYEWYREQLRNYQESLSLLLGKGLEEEGEDGQQTL